MRCNFIFYLISKIKQPSSNKITLPTIITSIASIHAPKQHQVRGDLVLDPGPNLVAVNKRQKRLPSVRPGAKEQTGVIPHRISGSLRVTVSLFVSYISTIPRPTDPWLPPNDSVFRTVSKCLCLNVQRKREQSNRLP